MKIVLFGAKGMVGSRILAEALRRQHEVTVVVRNPADFSSDAEKVTVVAGDASNASQVAQIAAGHDAVLSSVGPGRHANAQPENILRSVNAFLEALPAAGVQRLLLVGGAGSLEVAPGLQLVESPEFPAAFKAEASIARDALNILKNSNTSLNWTFFSPSIFIEPGERTGKFRVGGDAVLFDEQGQSRISAEDFAVAMLDELEQNQNPKRRITVGY